MDSLTLKNASTYLAEKHGRKVKPGTLRLYCWAHANPGRGPRGVPWLKGERDGRDWRVTTEALDLFATKKKITDG